MRQTPGGQRTSRGGTGNPVSGTLRTTEADLHMRILRQADVVLTIIENLR